MQKKLSVFVVAVTVAGWCGVAKPSDQPGVGANAQSLQGAGPTVSQPYSATVYERVLRTDADGRRAVKSESRGVKVARDADGRIRVEVVAECCVSTQVVLFDPEARTITPWLEGGRAAHVATHLELTAEQMNRAEALTRGVQVSVPGTMAKTGNLKTKALGERVIEGVQVTGVRESKVVSEDGTGEPVTISRDVWFSKEMNLVMMVVTRDPRTGEETVTGLQNISRNPDAALFRPPDEYTVSQSARPELAEHSLEQLARVNLK